MDRVCQPTHRRSYRFFDNTYIFVFIQISKVSSCGYDGIIRGFCYGKWFQGWLGGQVVRSGLTEWVITIHMLVAMAIVGVLIYAAFKAVNGDIPVKLHPDHKTIISTCCALSVTSHVDTNGSWNEVREAIDVISRGNPDLNRSLWVDNLGAIDAVHRSFSWLVIFSSVYLVWFAKKKVRSHRFLAGYQS